MPTAPARTAKTIKAGMAGSGAVTMFNEKLFNVEVSPGLKSAKKIVQDPCGSVLLKVARSELAV